MDATAVSQDVDRFLADHREFIEYLLEWKRGLSPIRLDELTDEGRKGRNLAILSVDLIRGFTTEGTLATPRIAGILPAVTDLLRRAYDAGVRDFALMQDTHPEDSPEFEAFGRHAVAGSSESQTDDELAALPFSNEFTVIPKVSLDPAAGTDLDPWFDERPALRSVIVVGDCTDICVYQAAMHLHTRAVTMRRGLRVIVPENCVQTYDLSVEAASKAGATPHDADFLHLVFLYHLSLCGIEVVSHVA